MQQQTQRHQLTRGTATPILLDILDSKSAQNRLTMKIENEKKVLPLNGKNNSCSTGTRIYIQL